MADVACRLIRAAGLISSSCRIFTVLGPFDIYGGGGADPLQRSRRDLVIQIFRLIDYPENLEVSVAALHAIADMADSSVFAPSSPYAPHKLYSILEASGELGFVMESCVRRLEREETEQVSPLSSHEIAAQHETFLANFGLANLVRLQILDFLIRNVSRPGYNLAHFLLGFSPELSSLPASKLPHHAEEGVPFTCFHLILELLAYGLGHPSSPIVALDHPSLGHRCYELLSVMLENPRTRRATVDYLRDHEDFYRKQLVFFAREPVDPSDVGYTIFEMLQKSALLRGALLDAHLAFADGAWTYARKLATALIRGTLDAKGEDKSGGIDGGQSLLSLMMASVEVVLTADYLTVLPSPVAEHMMAAIASLLHSCSKISQLVLAALDRIPYDHQLVSLLLSQLVSSQVPVLSRFQANPCASEAVLESCAALGVSITGGFANSRLSLEGAQLAGDEASVLVASSIACILRPDSSIITRGYSYSAICNCLQLSHLKDTPLLDTLKACVTSELSRLLEAASMDLQISSTEADGWKTIACTFMGCLADGASRDVVVEQLTKSGFIKNFTATLRSYDGHLLPLLERDCQSLNPLFLWKGVFSLLQKICLTETGMQSLIAAGFFDSASNLRILDWRPADAPAADAPQLLDQSRIVPRWHSLLLPLFRILSLFATSGSGVASNLALGFVTSKIGLVQLVLEAFETAQATEEQLDLCIACLRLLASLPISKTIVRLLKICLSRALHKLAPGEDRRYSEIVTLSLRALAMAAAETKISLQAETSPESGEKPRGEPEIARMATEALEKASGLLGRGADEPHLLELLEACRAIVSLTARPF